MPATFAHLNIAEQAPVVNAFTTNGFIIRGNRVYGSVALLVLGPSLLFSLWQQWTSTSELTSEAAVVTKAAAKKRNVERWGMAS